LAKLQAQDLDLFDQQSFFDGQSLTHKANQIKSRLFSAKNDGFT
jgi:hypothetical protein